MIHYEILPRTLNNMEQEFHIKVDLCFAFERHGFLERKTLNYITRWVAFNPLVAINTNIFFQL
jgi:hypothetical protein